MLFGKKKQAKPMDRLNMPRHVAIIMDGNGRWAKARGLPRAMGHRKGVEALRDIIDASDVLGIEALSVYAFSSDNWKRPQEEVSALMSLLVEFFSKEIDALHARGARIHCLGDLSALPQTARETALRAIEHTKDNKGLQLSIALNYGAREEIAGAAKELARQVKEGIIAVEDIKPSLFAQTLQTKDLPEIDLLIRTSGEMRLSNFMLYQCAYCEMLFPETLWPDFTKEAYHDALRAYQSRSRRFGGL